jgi:hypothetical protein
MKQTADEYHRRVHVCLSWAQHAPADDARRACFVAANGGIPNFAPARWQGRPPGWV